MNDWKCNEFKKNVSIQLIYAQYYMMFYNFTVKFYE